MADAIHARHDVYREGVGRPFDPTAFELAAVNEELARLGWRPLPTSAAAPTGP